MNRYVKAYYQRHKDERTAYSREYFQEHKLEIYEKQKERRRKNKKYYCVRCHNEFLPIGRERICKNCLKLEKKKKELARQEKMTRQQNEQQQKIIKKKEAFDKKKQERKRLKPSTPVKLTEAERMEMFRAALRKMRAA